MLVRWRGREEELHGREGEVAGGRRARRPREVAGALGRDGDAQGREQPWRRSGGSAADTACDQGTEEQTRMRVGPL